MELKYLHEFVVLARNGSFTDAARMMHITQSTLSKHVAALERDFGCELIARNRNGSALTAQGEVLYKRALEILEAIERTRMEITATEHNGAGRTIGMGGTIDYRLRKACAAAAQHYKLSSAQASALTRYLEGATLDDIAVEFGVTRDDVSVWLAEAYKALGVSSKQQAYGFLHSFLECG